jgi:hypothetical protein
LPQGIPFLPRPAWRVPRFVYFMRESPATSAPPVAVHLLDPTFERPLKSWRFVQQGVITIGRSDDRDIEISDPYVSRNHAELHYLDNRWVLVAKGRNGVLVHEQAVEQYEAPGDVTFRLGPQGPALRFEISGAAPENSHTLCFDTLPVNFFGVDRHKVEREVEEIAEGDYFRTLHDKAAGLRRRREGT